MLEDFTPIMQGYHQGDGGIGAWDLLVDTFSAWRRYGVVGLGDGGIVAAASELCGVLLGVGRRSVIGGLLAVRRRQAVYSTP